jgi:hypothetical protein
LVVRIYLLKNIFSKLFSGFQIWTFCGDVIHIIQKHPVGAFCSFGGFLPIMLMILLSAIFYGVNYKVCLRVIWIIFLHPFQNVQNQKPNLLLKFFIQNNIINQ